MTLAVLDALDSARTQWYHITAIVIAGMGFFTDAYNLFCISTVAKLLGRLYCFDPDSSKPGKLRHNVNNMVIGVALVGTLTGQLVFGWLGGKLGRKKVYGFTLILMVICAICSGLSFGSSLRLHSHSHGHLRHLFRLIVRFNTKIRNKHPLFLQVLAWLWYWWRLSSFCYDNVRTCQQKNSWRFHCGSFCHARRGNYFCGIGFYVVFKSVLIGLQRAHIQRG